MKFPTNHIGANRDEVANTVIMPGDPLRAKFIAEEFLQDVRCFNKIRNMLGYTGIYRGNRVSVMGSGMGIPSMGIYSHELYNFYEVEKIIRVGTAGCIVQNMDLKDLVIAMGACTNSNFTEQFCLQGTFAPIASYNLVSKAVGCAQKKGLKFIVGNVLSSDYIYGENKEFIDKWNKMGIIAFEMEAAALYTNAAVSGREALCLLAISDCLLTGKSLSHEEREKGFMDIIKVALCCCV
ncbi:MAG: purine-nucleoside phosphorylase [Oscillospiraceae bacterium]|jgi:purine-nucleoside phosphorylase|nr:purine-nucleoside phosphorylase [Oscillospiraceae bacterium]